MCVKCNDGPIFFARRRGGRMFARIGGLRPEGVGDAELSPCAIQSYTAGAEWEWDMVICQQTVQEGWISKESTIRGMVLVKTTIDIIYTSKYDIIPQ